MNARIRRRKAGRLVWMALAVLGVLLNAGCASDGPDAAATDATAPAEMADAAPVEDAATSADADGESAEAELAESMEGPEAESAEAEAAESIEGPVVEAVDADVESAEAEPAESIEGPEVEAADAGGEFAESTEGPEAADEAEGAEFAEAAEAEPGELAEDYVAEDVASSADADDESAEAELVELEESAEAEAADTPTDGGADDLSELPPSLFSQDQLAHFETTIESLRETLKIPGISAAVVRDGELIWAKGFGYANLEQQIPAMADTPYGLASVTKTFAAFLLMRLVEDGLLDLDTPAIEYGIDLGNEALTVRHVLTHTSEGAPGTRYQYSGDRYAMLTPVIEQLYGAPFRNVLRREILDPLGMNDTALNVGACGLTYYLSALGPDDPEQALEHVYQDAAVPYQYDESYEVYPVAAPTYANAAAGLISSVVDLARFAAAIERDELVRPETQARMFAPTVLCPGGSSPYGLGWFTERTGDTELIWHYGYGAYSSLFLMLPSEGLTFIILANTQNMSRPFGLGIEGVSVLGSPFALAFFKEFVLQCQFDEPLPEIDWTAETASIVEQLAGIEDPGLLALYEDELWTYRKLYAGVGETGIVDRLTFAHLEAFPDVIPATHDVYQVGHPGPRPEEVESVALSAKQAARWIGRYTLRPDDAESGLPLEMELFVDGERIVGVAAGDDCQEFLAITPFRLLSASNPGLFLVAEEGDRRFASGQVEYAGEIIATYKRVK